MDQICRYVPEFFAAANTGDGFFGLFEKVFEKAGKLYIIKGGPGTGKSSFMRRAAIYAAGHGWQIQLIYCSSDPESLDGVIAERGGVTVAIADGTLPHSIEPKLPGVRDEIINLGENWDPSVLEASKNEIVSLGKTKKQSIASAYSMLKCAKQAEESADGLTLPCIDLRVIRDIAERYAGALSHGVRGAEYRRIFADALSMHGKVGLPVFEECAAEKYCVRSFYGVGNTFLSTLCGLARNWSINCCEISYPLIPDKVCGVYFPDDRILFRVCDTAPEDWQEINVRRAVDPGRFRGVRSTVRYLFGVRDGLIGCALSELGKAGHIHAELEEIYKSAMDFSANQKKCEIFCRKVFD